jgi:hypothetical protein
MASARAPQAFAQFGSPSSALNRIALTALALALVVAAGPALPQASVALVKVDVNVVEQGYRMSKLIGRNVINDKNEKIGSIDDNGNKITLPGASKDELKKLSEIKYQSS